MAYGRDRSSIFEGFTLSPLPYPVLLILAVIFIFLGLQWYASYEEVLETTEQSLGWVLFVIPVVIVIVVRWLSSMENSDWLFSSVGSVDRRRRTNYLTSEGSSPWAVAAVILLLLVMVQYRSAFLDSWFPFFSS